MLLLRLVIHYNMSSSVLFTGTDTATSSASPKSKWFELIQDIEGVHGTTKHSPTRSSRTASESGKGDGARGTGVSEAKYFRGTNGNVPFTVINLKYVSIHYILQ